MLGQVLGLGTIKKWKRIGVGCALLGFVILSVVAFARCKGQVTEAVQMASALLSAAFMIGGVGTFGMADRLAFKIELERRCQCGYRSRPGSKSCDNCGHEKTSLEDCDIGVS